MKELKVGDVVYGYRHSKIISKYTIDRVTKTQAISKMTKFRKQYTEDGYVCGVGETTFGLPSYWIETPERKNEFVEATINNKLSKTNWKEISVEKKIKIMEILKDGE